MSIVDMIESESLYSQLLIVYTWPHTLGQLSANKTNGKATF